MKRIADTELCILETTYYNTDEVKPRTIISKLISGGNTGADRAALEAAYMVGIETGGVCPAGFITSKGKDAIIGSKFGLKEMENPSGKMGIAQMYVRRSMLNVDSSCGTLAFRLAASKGTDLTIGYAMRKKWQSMGESALKEDVKTKYRPILIITNVEEKNDCDNVRLIRQFVAQNKIECLNVCGHREEVVKDFSKRITSLLVKALVITKKVVLA